MPVIMDLISSTSSLHFELFADRALSDIHTMRFLRLNIEGWPYADITILRAIVTCLYGVVILSVLQVVGICVLGSMGTGDFAHDAWGIMMVSAVWLTPYPAYSKSI